MGHSRWQFTLLLWTIALVESATPEPSLSQLLEVHRYFFDQSFSTRQYACSEKEHECLSNGTLFYEGDGQCYPAGSQGPCGAGEAFHADRAEAARLGGHLRGTCAAACADASAAPLAATGRCLTRSEVQAQVCRSEWYLTPAKDAFGEWVCQWSTLPCSPPRNTHRHFGRGKRPYSGICRAHDIFRMEGVRNSSANNETTEAPSDHPLLRFFANASYLELEFPCTAEQKLCLDYGAVLHSDGQCYRPNQAMRKCEPGQSFHIDREAAMAVEGALQGTCRSRCRGFTRPVAATGECITYGNMSNQICRRDWGMKPTYDAFGELVCQCARGFNSPPPPPPTLPPAATAPGHCRLPDFQNPVRPPQYDRTLTLGFSVACTEEWHACLREGRVLAGGACHALRTQGPCADGEQLLLDKEALAHARLEAVCRALPCPVGSVPMPVDGRCLTHQQVSTMLCQGQTVALDEFGGWQCNYRSEFPGNLSRTVRHAANATCELLPKNSGFPRPVPGADYGGRPGGGAGGGVRRHPHRPRPHPPPPPPFTSGAGLGGGPDFHHNSVGGGPSF